MDRRSGEPAVNDEERRGSDAPPWPNGPDGPNNPNNPARPNPNNPEAPVRTQRRSARPSGAETPIPPEAEDNRRAPRNVIGRKRP